MYQSTNPETNNTIPIAWYRTIRHDGKADTIAIVLLSDISSSKAQSLGRAYKDNLILVSYKECNDLFGFSTKQIRKAFIRLEKLGILERVLKSVDTPVGKIHNVLFIKLNPQVLHNFTFPIPQA